MRFRRELGAELDEVTRLAEVGFKGKVLLRLIRQDWIAAAGTRTATIAPGSPWENGYVDSFNARPRDKLLEG